MVDQVRSFIRFKYQNQIQYGCLQGTQVTCLRGDLFHDPVETEQGLRLEDVQLLVPCEPTKILCVALNYANHLEGRSVPVQPEIFVVPTTALLAPGGIIKIPAGTYPCEYEGELVVVMGKTAKQVSETEATDYIFGVTCGNDISARDWQKKDLQWWRAKGCDTFAPLGPAIVCGLDYSDLLLTSRLNGEVKQQQRTLDLIFSPAQLVSFISQYMTLNPGDVIYTGTPGATSPMKVGDQVEVEIEGIGVLRNEIG